MKNKVLILCIFLCFGTGAYAQQDKTWTLEDCINYALNQNIQVRKGALNNRRLQTNSEQARAQRLPSVNASVSQNFNWVKSNATGSSGRSATNGSGYSVNSGVTIFNGARLTNQIKQSELNIEGGIYSLQTTKEFISLNILDSFLQILFAEEQVRDSEKQLESTASQLNLAEERFARQVISQADYAQVKSQLASEKLTLANAQSQLAIAKVNLMQLMELPVTGNFIIAHPLLSETLNEKRMPDVKTTYEAALLIKPQIKNAAINKKVAALDETIAKSGYFPTLSASAGISSNYSSEAIGTYPDQLNNGMRPIAGFSLSIPVYQKNQIKSSVALAKISYQEAELSETDTKNQLRKSIEQACQDVFSAQIEYDASLEKYKATQESAALSEEKYTQGIINSVDFLVSKTNLIVAESQFLQSKYNLIFSYKILDFYTGIPLTL